MLKKKRFLERKSVKKALPKKLLSFLILGFFLMALCMSVSDAKESTSLQKSPFVNVEILDPKYDHVYETEMVKNGSEVSIKVILTNFSKEIDKSTLIFYSELEEEGGHISVDGSPAEVLKSGSSYTVEHKKVEKGVVVAWSGTAPEVGKQEPCTLLNITQETTEKVYSVVDIKEDVTSEIIEAALDAWHKAKEAVENANWTIANATGVDVSEARRTLKLANEYLNNSRDSYGGGRPEEALEEAKKALASAGDAKKFAEGAKATQEFGIYGILAVVMIIVVVVCVFLIMQRRRKRGIY